MTRSRRIAVLAALALTTCLAACTLLEPRPDRSRFYVLSTVEKPADVAHPELTVGLGPIDVPDYAQRQEIMRRISPTEVSPSPSDRWAGAFETNVSRALAENLARVLGTERVWAYPSYEISRTAYLVNVTFVRFELDDDNTTHLIARWDVRERAQNRNTSRETDTSAAATSADMAAGVEAMSQLLGTLSEQIGAAILELR